MSCLLAPPRDAHGSMVHTHEDMVVAPKVSMAADLSAVEVAEAMATDVAVLAMVITAMVVNRAPVADRDVFTTSMTSRALSALTMQTA